MLPVAEPEAVNLPHVHLILGLQWEHVNFLARTIFIAKSTTERIRTIPMNDIVLAELKALKQDAGPKEFGSPMPVRVSISIPSRQAGGMLAKTWVS